MLAKPPYSEDFLETFVGLDMVFLEANLFKCININNISFKTEVRLNMTNAYNFLVL